MASPTSLTRRKMLQVSGIGALALTVPLPAASAAAAAAPPHLRRSSYLGFVGRPFAVDGGPELRLVSVRDLDRARTDAGLRDHEEAFVLTFAGPIAPVAASGIHPLRHPELGTATLFITPVQRAGTEQAYEVLVDRTVRLASWLDAPPVDETALETAVPAASAADRSVHSAPSPAVPAPASRPKPSRLRIRAKAQRTGSRVATDLQFPGGGVQAVRVRLMRGGRTHARGEGAVRQGRATLSLKPLRRTPRGTYELVITATDRRGHVTTVSRSVKVR